LLATEPVLGYNKSNYVKGAVLALKDLSMLVWLTQLGLSVAVSPALFVWLAVWLRDYWGGWVLWAGIALALYTAVTGLLSSLRTMQQMSEKQEKDAPPVAFNDHE
jgi:hypothetical protein